MSFDYALRVLGAKEVTIACTAANRVMQGLMERKIGLEAVKIDTETSDFWSERLYTIERRDIF